MDIKDFATDVERVSSGRWVGDLPGLPGIALKVRGLGAPEVRALRNKLARSAPKKDRDSRGMLTEAAAERMGAEVRLKAMLLDWRGFTRDGEPFAYDEKTAKLWLTDPAYYKFAEAVDVAASRVEENEAEFFEDVEKN